MGVATLFPMLKIWNDYVWLRWWWYECLWEKAMRNEFTWCKKWCDLDLDVLFKLCFTFIINVYVPLFKKFFNSYATLVLWECYETTSYFGYRKYRSRYNSYEMEVVFLLRNFRPVTRPVLKCLFICLCFEPAFHGYTVASPMA